MNESEKYIEININKVNNGKIKRNICKKYRKIKI